MTPNPLRLGVAENWTRGHEGFKPLAYTAQFGRERTKLKGVGGQWRASRPHSSCTLPLCRGSTDEKTFGCEFPVTSSADVNHSDALESRRRDCFFGVPLNSVVVRSVENSAFVSIASEKILLASPAQRFCAFQNDGFLRVLAVSLPLAQVGMRSTYCVSVRALFKPTCSVRIPSCCGRPISKYMKVFCLWGRSQGRLR